MSGFSFRKASRPTAALGAVPMINVAFLLLVFFLLAARIAPPDPVTVTLPEAESGASIAPLDALYVGADGSLAYRDATGETVFAALASAAPTGPLSLRVDQSFDGAELAGVLARLAEVGISGVSLLVAPAP